MADHDQKYTERPSSFPWPPVLWFSAMLAAWLLQRAWPMPWPGLDDTAARAIGLAIGFGGILLLLWAVWTLRAAGTTVLPDKGADVLVTRGPFRHLRNPIYLGHVMIMLGLAETTKNIWFVMLAGAHAILVTAFAIIPEEQHLEAKFGDAYRDYKQRSRRWI